MSANIAIDKTKTDSEIYEQLIPSIKSLINKEEPLICALANITSVLKDTFDKISWVGFYLAKEEKLFLGPFQGKTACTVIDFGKGVCGYSAAVKKTIIVENVNEFPGHIACDENSLSEIVVPLTENGAVAAVLDIDSHSYSSFSEIDKNYLEILCTFISDNFQFRKGLL